MVIGSLLGVDFEHKEFVSGEAGTSAIAQRKFPERFCRHRSSDRAVNLCFNYLHVSSGIFFISYEKIETTRRCARNSALSRVSIAKYRRWVFNVLHQ